MGQQSIRKNSLSEMLSRINDENIHEEIKTFGLRISKGLFALNVIAFIEYLIYHPKMNELRAHIVIDNEIRFGKPCIKGTRITVGDILQWLSSGMTEQEIIDDYPELQQIHIKAALAFAAERDMVTRVIVHETVA